MTPCGAVETTTGPGWRLRSGVQWRRFLPDIGGGQGRESYPRSWKLFCISKPKILCFLTQCVVGICEYVIGFCEIAACSRICGRNTKSLIILSTAAGENRFFLLVDICCYISVVLCKLFKIIMQCSYVPAWFRHGYIVPIPKLKETRSKSMSCDDFRGIAISPIISKVVEHCVLDRFQIFFSVLMLSLVSRKV